MKLVTFLTAEGSERIGALNGDETRVVDLAAADDQLYFGSMLDLMEAGKSGLDRARDILSASSADAGLDLAGLTLRTPVPMPLQILSLIHI